MIRLEGLDDKGGFLHVYRCPKLDRFAPAETISNIRDDEHAKEADESEWIGGFRYL